MLILSHLFIKQLFTYIFFLFILFWEEELSIIEGIENDQCVLVMSVILYVIIKMRTIIRITKHSDISSIQKWNTNK